MGAHLHLGWLPDCKYRKNPRDSALIRWRKCWMPLFFVEIMFCTHNNVLWWNVRNIGCKAAYSRICKCCSSYFKQQITVVKLAILSPYRIINLKSATALIRWHRGQKGSDTVAKEGATQQKSPQRRIKSPYPTMRLETIRKITTISCRCHPKSFWNTSA